MATSIVNYIHICYNKNRVASIGSVATLPKNFLGKSPNLDAATCLWPQTGFQNIVLFLHAGRR